MLQSSDIWLTFLKLWLGLDPHLRGGLKYPEALIGVGKFVMEPSEALAKSGGASISGGAHRA